MSSEITGNYESFPNDPYGVRIYTLSNGLKVYLAQNFDEPRIKTRIAVRAGASYDPDEATGLAHYVEHMMFKGTDLIGALDREKEASIISKIKSKYEDLALAESSDDINIINREIDSLSRAASMEAVPGELDKLYSLMGCKNTNARTGFEETVYENDIPTVELERWISLERERFTSPVLRLFPPELEVVYEEFNQAQDDDVSRAYDKLLASLFPTHPYGRAGILGRGEHLKKPSMEKIEEFLNRWYCPSNMAIALSGDLDFDKTITLINSYWGNIETSEVETPEKRVEISLEKPAINTVHGEDSPFVLIGYRFGGLGSDDELYLTLIDMIMSNNQAGILDLNLVQKQLLLEAETSYEVYREYSWFTLYGVPGKNQSLKSVGKLLLNEIKKIKSGEFEEWYTDAVIRCFQIDQLQELESANKIESFIDSFITGISWENYLKRIERLKSITRESLIEFVNRKFINNYSIVYKKKGEAKDLFLINKPNLTPVILNREIESSFCKDFKMIEVERNRPQFADFKEINKTSIGEGRSFYYVKNWENDLFELSFSISRGRLHDLISHYSSEYRDFTGTIEYPGREFNQELFKLGLDLVYSVGDESTVLTLTGRSEDFNRGLELLTGFILQGQESGKGYRKFLKRVTVLRDNAKKNKRVILWGAMYNYLHYGDENPFRHYLTIGELKRIGSVRLMESVRESFSYPVDILYDGPEDMDLIKNRVSSFIKRIEYKNKKSSAQPFLFIKNNQKRFLFSEYDMVQGEILVTGVGVKFDLELLPVISLFNDYFGGGMDSVVFQEVRERRGLAYSAYASYSIPRDDSGNFMFNFYVGTQGDKVVDALRCILGLLEFFPRAKNYFDAVKRGILKNIESEKLKNSNYYYSLKESEKYGLDMEIREFVYKRVKEITLDDLEGFFNRYIRDLRTHVLLLGSCENIDMEEAETLLGVKAEKIKLKSVFGY